MNPHSPDFMGSVLQFMAVGKQHIAGDPKTLAGVYAAAPVIPPADVVALRRRLLAEEVDETLAAVDAGDMIEIADGIADIIYVAIGMAFAYGIPLADVWRAVHEANMNKFVRCSCIRVMEDGSVDSRMFCDKCGHTGLVKLVIDGKISKPPGWVKADVEGVLLAHGWVKP